MFNGLCFWVLEPFILKGQNFFSCNPFLTILNAPDAPIGGVQLLFEHQKQ
jgi:hypothetical protein